MSAAFIASRAAYLVARIAALGGRGAQQIAMRGLPRSRAAAIADAARPGIRGLGYECVRAGQPMPEVVEVGQLLLIGGVLDGLLPLAGASREGEGEGRVRYLPLR